MCREVFSVLALGDSCARRIVKAAMKPACLTLVGLTTPSLAVCRAVVRVRMMKHLAGDTPLVQAGATIGEELCPSSTMLAEAALGASAAASAKTAAVTSGSR